MNPFKLALLAVALVVSVNAVPAAPVVVPVQSVGVDRVVATSADAVRPVGVVRTNAVAVVPDVAVVSVATTPVGVVEVDVL